MYNEKIEALIKAALADGVLTEKEKQVLFKNAQEQGIDLDEFEMVLDARLVELQKAEKEKAEKSAPKSNKYGDVRKCPACGALVAAFKGACQECGYEFTNIDSNLSSKLLADKLLSESSDKKKIEIIETFPIPNTKADLLEFLTAIKPKLIGDRNQFTNAYLKKYQECIEKAKTAFEGDKQLQRFIDEYPSIEKQIKWKRIKYVFNNAIDWISENWITIISFVVVLAIFGWIGSCIVKCAGPTETEKYQPQFKEALSKGNLDNAKEILSLYGNLDDAKTLIESYLAQDDVDNAIYVFEKITGHESRYDAEKLDEDSYSRACMKLIYDKLIETKQFDKAWNYHLLEYKNENYAGNAQCYYQYMSDVVMYLCISGDKNAAKQFVKDKAVWFQKNVDKGEWGEEYIDEFSYEKVKKSLLNIINEY